MYSGSFFIVQELKHRLNLNNDCIKCIRNGSRKVHRPIILHFNYVRNSRISRNIREHFILTLAPRKFKMINLPLQFRLKKILHLQYASFRETMTLQEFDSSIFVESTVRSNYFPLLLLRHSNSIPSRNEDKYVNYCNKSSLRRAIVQEKVYCLFTSKDYSDAYLESPVRRFFFSFAITFPNGSNLKRSYISYFWVVLFSPCNEIDVDRSCTSLEIQRPRYSAMQILGFSVRVYGHFCSYLERCN